MSVRSSTFAVAAVFLSLLTASAARAQSVEEWRQTEETQEKAPPKLEQKYHGVTPGSGNPLPRVEELKNREGTWVTWPGFIIRSDGGSRIFLQTTIALEYKLAEKNLTMSLELNNAHVYLSNNRNPLVTTHFNTPVKRTFLKERNELVELVLEFKTKTSPIITQAIDKDGYHYLYIDFAPGQYPILELKVDNTPGASDETSGEIPSFSNQSQ